MNKLLHLRIRPFCSQDLILSISRVPRRFHSCVQKTFSVSKVLLNDKRTPKMSSLQYRSFLSKRNPKSYSKEELENLQSYDTAPKTYTLIYNSTLGNYLLGAQVTLLVTVFIVTGSFVVRYLKQHGIIDVLNNAPIAEAVYVGSEQKFFELKTQIKQIQGEAERRGTGTRQFDGSDIEDLDEILPYLGLIIIAGAITSAKVIKGFPLRIWASPKGHCISVHWHPVIPYKQTFREFRMGTMRQVPSSKNFSNRPFSGCSFTDPAGRSFYMLEDAFRHPQDLCNLLEDESDYQKQRNNEETN